MSTRSDYNIKISEAFFNIPDTLDIDTQKFVINNSNWIGQVFIANSNELQKIFFLCDNTEGLEINIHKASIEIVNGQQIFTPGQMVVSIFHEVDGPSPFVEVESGEDEPAAKWYYPNWLATPQIDDSEAHYIAVFKTTTNKTPSIYWTLKYRQTIFSQIIGWDGESWSNGNIDTLSSGNIQVGAVCFGHIGNDLKNSILDSGSLIVGGRDSARRGYPIYAIVENISSQIDKVIVDLSMLNPEDSSDGSDNETSQAMMKWYRFSPKTLPTSSNLDLIGSDIKAELDSTNHFVIYTQPDKLSPLAEPFLPESEFNLYSNPVGFVPIYGSYGFNSSGLSDSTSRFQLDYWANFAKERKVVTSNNKRVALSSQNPDYVDFSLEDPDGDIDLLKNITLTTAALDGTFSEVDLVRGFNKSIFYKDKYVFFSKKLTEASFLPASPGKLLAYIFNETLTTSSKKYISFLDSSPTTIGSDSYITGIHDIIRRTINGVETLVFVFQNTRPNSASHPWFDIGYYTGDWSESVINIQLIGHDSAGAGIITGELGRFNADDEASVDGEGIITIIEPKNLSSFYIAVRGDYGLAMFEIKDSDVLSSTYVAKIVDTNNSSLLTGIADDNDHGVDYVVYDGNTTYLGVRRSYDDGFFATIYRTNDFITFEQLFSGSLASPSSPMSGFSFSQPNNRVAFMCKVKNMLHVWMTPSIYNSDNSPIHLAIDTISKSAYIVRRFPIVDAGDSNYSSLPNISDLSAFPRSKSLRYISGGCISGSKIYIYGADTIEYYATPFDTTPESYATRWLVYDDRTINDFLSFTNVSGKGRYNGKTIASLTYDDGSNVFENYPALSPDSVSITNNPQVLIYCGAVNTASSTNTGIDGSNANVPDYIFNYGGIVYLTTRNYNSNFDIFKTYGVKELSYFWGRSLTDSNGGPSNINAYQKANIDNANYEKVVAGAKAVFSYLTRRSIPLFANGVVFFSEIKSNIANTGFQNTDPAYTKRTIMVLKRSLRKPQSISAIYSLRYTGTGGSNERNKLLDTLTSETALTIKGAQTLEDLYFNPDFTETIPLSFDLSKDENDLYLINRTFPTDLNSNFFRIESPELLDVSGSPIVSINIKNLGLFDIDPSGSEQNIKSVAINGLVKTVNSNPENILRNGIELSPNGEVIIDFVKPTYINEISFDATYLSRDYVANEMTEFEFSAIFAAEKRNSGANIIGPDDWSILADNVKFSGLTNKKNIRIENVGSYVSKIKIKLVSSYSFKIDKFKTKGFFLGSSSVTVDGSIKSPNSIFFDDISGLVEFPTISNATSSFSVFESNNCNMTIDLGDSYPISRIAMNVAGEGETSTRTVVVETWDGSTYEDGDPVYENIFTGPAPNYEFSIVRWIPRLTDKSRNVELEFLDSAAPYTPDEILTDSNIGDLLLDYNNISNNSGLLSRSGLAGWSFKPSLFNDRSLSVISSESRFETGSDIDYFDEDADGLITVNCQMDSDGPFAQYIGENTLGLLENKISIDFATKNVRFIKITIRNQKSGDGAIRINGLRLFAPVKDSTGLAISPVEVAQWNMKFNFSVSSE